MALSADEWRQLAARAEYSTAAAARLAPPEGAAATLLLKATLAIKLRDYEAAMALLDEAVSASPSHFLLRDLRAGCALQACAGQRALDDAMLCTVLNPTWARGWARLGAAQLVCGHPGPAAAAYRRGLELDPANEEMEMGLELAQQGLLTRRGRRAAEHHR